MVSYVNILGYSNFFFTDLEFIYIHILSKFISSVSKSVNIFTALIINYCCYRNSSFHPSNAHKSQFFKLYNELFLSRKSCKSSTSKHIVCWTRKHFYLLCILFVDLVYFVEALTCWQFFRDKLLCGFDIHIYSATSYKIIIPRNSCWFSVLLIKIFKKLFSPRRKLYTHDKGAHHSI